MGMQVDGLRLSSPHHLACWILWLEEIPQSFSVLVKWRFAVPSHIVGVHIYGKRGDMSDPTIRIGGYVLKEYIPPPG